jgi:hypothetical protein
VLVDHLSNKVDRSSHHGGLAVADERIELPLGSENWIRGAGHSEPTSEFDAVTGSTLLPIAPPPVATPVSDSFPP